MGNHPSSEDHPWWVSREGKNCVNTKEQLIHVHSRGHLLWGTPLHNMGQPYFEVSLEQGRPSLWVIGFAPIGWKKDIFPGTFPLDGYYGVWGFFEDTVGRFLLEEGPRRLLGHGRPSTVLGLGVNRHNQFFVTRNSQVIKSDSHSLPLFPGSPPLYAFLLVGEYGETVFKYNMTAEPPLQLFTAHTFSNQPFHAPIIPIRHKNMEIQETLFAQLPPEVVKHIARLASLPGSRLLLLSKQFHHKLAPSLPFINPTTLANELLGDYIETNPDFIIHLILQNSYNFILKLKYISPRRFFKESTGVWCLRRYKGLSKVILGVAEPLRKCAFDVQELKQLKKTNDEAIKCFRNYY